MFWAQREADDVNVFLISEEGQFTFSEIFELGDSFFENKKPGVCLVRCKRTVHTVAAYVGALRNGFVPFLVDAKLPINQVRELANTYEIELVLSESDLGLQEYRVGSTFGPFRSFCRGEAPGSQISDKLSLLLPTSGSTGGAKCVRSSAENIVSCTREIVRYTKLDSSSVSISSLPFHYTYGLSLLNCALESRSKMVLTEKSILEKGFWSLMEANSVTEFAGVPFMYEALRRIKLSDVILNNLRTATQAGGRLDPSITKYFLEFFAAHKIDYFTMYGQTEASPRISYVPPSKGLEKLGSVGIPIAIGKFYVESENDSGEGELVYSGPNVCLGYAFNRRDLSKGDTNSGVLRTGDYATIDCDGFATIVGRKKRYIKVFGMSVNLDDIESKLKSQGFHAAVIGEENLVQIFTDKGDVDLIKKFLGQTVALPISAVKCCQVLEIPYMTSGKVDYLRLANESA